jgi:hypothetical protein
MMRRRPRLPLGLLASCVLLAGLAGAPPAFGQGEASWWHLTSNSTPTYLPPGGEGTISVSATNLGDAEVKASEAHPVTVTESLPAGLTVTAISAVKWPQANTVVQAPKCTPLASSASCTFTEILAPYEQWEVKITVKIAASVPSGSEDEAKVEGGEEPGGGEVPSRSLRHALRVSSEPTPFGVEDYELAPESEEGSAEAQAGAHPFQLSTTLTLNQIYYDFGPERNYRSVPLPLVRDLHVNLPPGLIGNTLALPQCTELQFTTILLNGPNACPDDAAIGAALASLTEPVTLGTQTLSAPVYNLVPAPGEPARFGFVVLGVPVLLDTVVRGGDYHVVASISNISQEPALLSSLVTLWGVPGDPRHDKSRGAQCLARGARGVPGVACKPLNEQHPLPFLTLPTSCTGPLRTTIEAESWLAGASFLAPVAPSFTESLQGCSQLPFTPEISVTPQQQETNTPTGLTVVLKVPQTSTLEEKGLAEADLRNTTLKLPVGMQLNPSAANGLAACSLEQIGFTGVNASTGTEEFSSNPASCPDASKLGTVQIKTPLLEHELHGSVYQAAQNENPFGSLFAIYAAVEDPVSGVLVKLAGKVTLNEETGQVTSTFANGPQLPFEELKLELIDGPRAPLATPRSCGSYAAQTSFTPWSGSELLETSLGQEFTITSGPHGTPCSNPQPFNPGFQAGSANSQAGAFTPFTLTITRADTDQALKSASITLPPGLVGLISQVKLCPEPQAEQGTCGPESLIGHATAIAGLGEDPFTETGGKIYITGPYHGAPFGLSIVIPTVAGPFNFGNVVTRSTIDVDPNTAAITTNSELPTILNTTSYHTGVPAQLRRVDVTVERPGGEPFQFNPTSCKPMKVTGTLSGDQGASAAVSYPFQAANCARLPFAPKLTAATEGQASKANGASFVVKIESAGLGQANIAKVDLQLPIALPSRLTTLQKACVAAVFAANPAACDEGSLVGTATIHTPVFKNPLTGPVYLVSHGGAEFPDVEIVLQGEGVTIVLDGKTDIKKGITYSRFQAAHDAPFTMFETNLPTGPHSALTANVPESAKFNLCGTTLLMPTEITAQNGLLIKQTTNIALTGCPPSLRMIKAQVRGNTILVTVKLSQEGTVKITGKGLKTTVKRGLKAGTHAISVPLTKAGKAAKRGHKKIELKASLSVGRQTATGTATVKA